MAESLKDILAAMRAGVVPPHQRDEELLAYLADRIEAAAERERRTYERLHECFWDKWIIQCIVRQMRDDADDLRHAFPMASEKLDAYAGALVKSAKNCPNSGPKIGQLDAPASDELTKGEKVSTSHEPGDAVTESLTDIVRDLRDCANRVEDDLHEEDVWTNTEAAWIYRDLADRIEAAARRDLSSAADDAASKATLDRTAKDAAEYLAYAMAHNSAPQSTNTAALREALVKIYREVRSYCFDYGAGESHKSLVDRIVDDPPDYTCFRDSILEIDGIVDAALAAPPRKGKWKNGRSYEYEYAYCSECGRMQWAGWDSHRQAEENIESFADNYRFCPGCGAEMEGGVYVR